MDRLLARNVHILARSVVERPGATAICSGRAVNAGRLTIVEEVELRRSRVVLRFGV